MQEIWATGLLEWNGWWWGGGGWGGWGWIFD